MHCKSIIRFRKVPVSPPGTFFVEQKQEKKRRNAILGTEKKEEKPSLSLRSCPPQAMRGNHTKKNSKKPELSLSLSTPLGKSVAMLSAQNPYSNSSSWKMKPPVVRWIPPRPWRQIARPVFSASPTSLTSLHPA